MKKFFSVIIAAAALLVSANSCDMLVTEPVFVPASAIALNGQSMVLTRASLVDFLWKADKAQYCTFEPNPTIQGEGKEAWATFNISSSKNNSEEITITGINNDDIEHTSDQIVSVHKWIIALYDEEDNKLTPVTGATYNVAAGSKVVAKLYDVVLDQTVENIVIRGIEKKDKPMYGELKWESSRLSFVEDYEPAATTATFVYKGVMSTFFLSASIGEVKYEFSINQKY